MMIYWFFAPERPMGSNALFQNLLQRLPETETVICSGVSF